VADADANDVNQAAEAAQRAFDEGTWSRSSIQERARVVNRFADLFEGDLPAFFTLETLNNGRPIAEASAQISRLPQFYTSLRLALTRRSDVIPVEGSYLCYTQRVPLGVVGLMTSFNHPLMILSKSLAPALAAGNSVVHQAFRTNAAHDRSPG
jgi:phenylacetaldehyde dehydrogenase